MTRSITKIFLLTGMCFYLFTTAFAGTNNKSKQQIKDESNVFSLTQSVDMSAKQANLDAHVFKSNASKVPPANDDICNAIEITVGAAPIIGDNREATVEVGEPLPACWFDASLDSTVWFFYVESGGGTYTVNTDLAVLINDDTQLGLYTSSGGCTGTLTEIACNDDVSGTNFLSTASYTSAGGDTVWVQVDGWSATSGTFEIEVTFVPTPAGGDAAVVDSRGSGIAGNYTDVPTSQANGNNIGLEVFVTNLGADSLTGVTVNGTITPGGAVTGSIPVLQSGGNDLITTNTISATTSTAYTANFTITSNEPDADTSNNSGSLSFTTAAVGDSIYARESATTSNVNLGFTGGTGRFGNIYTVNNTDTLSSITVYLGGDPTGKTFELFVGQLNGTGDIYSSATISGLTAIGFYTFDVGGVILTPGDYLIGVNQSTTTNIAVGLTTSVFYPNTAYFGGYGAWNTIESIGNPAFNGSFMVRANFGPVISTSLTPFTLIAPADGTLLDVTGAGTQTVNISWNATTPTPAATVNYDWLLDAQGGNFSNPLATISAGTNTSLTLDYTTIDALLASLGFNIGDTAFTSWTVRASAPGAVLDATAAFDLDLIRSGLTPASGSRDFEAYNAGDLIVASDPEWEFWPGATIDAPVSTAQAQSGTNSLLIDGAPNQDLVFKLGDQTTGTWGVGFSMYIATGNGAYYNLQETEVPGTRWPIGNVEFDPGGTGTIDLVTPAATFTFPHDQWFDVRNYIDLDNDSFQVWIDNTLVLSEAWTFNGGVTQLGGINIYPQGDAGNPPAQQVFYLDDMYFQPDSLRTPVTYSFSPFNLTSPPDQTRLEVEAGNATPVVIDWDATTVTPTATPMYNWYLDVQGGTFTNPLLDFASDNGGMDSQLTLTSGAIDTELANLGIPPGDSVDVIWTVEASVLGQGAFAANGPFDIRLVRIDNSSLDASAIARNVSFFPNPTEGQLVVKVKENAVNNVVIQSMIGQNLKSFEINSTTNVLDLSDLSSGMYIIRFVSDSEEFSQKIIIE